ncbi:MAG: PD40 domain-containing protein [Chloroflexi bacterium]|nr:PD40 domain-containing protein [Chloroflexota bacterium]
MTFNLRERGRGADGKPVEALQFGDVLKADDMRAGVEAAFVVGKQVGPAGDEIVFDFLGDIYTIPITGGSAKALTDEIAWNIQPRYSPDGRFIAFISDRGGGDNIWVMDRDGTGLKQITEEDYRLVHCPAWTPDSQYIAARKHFTSKRSLGAGEVWLYHISGGEGVQMIERPNDQKDLNEPAFSPDGRYLYFCQDTTAGKVFEYNKDSNKEIYVIKRLDRVTGEVQRYVTGPGGAVRPTPSPDGKYLAVRSFSGTSIANPGSSQLVIVSRASGSRFVVASGEVEVIGWVKR